MKFESSILCLDCSVMLQSKLASTLASKLLHLLPFLCCVAAVCNSTVTQCEESKIFIHNVLK